MTEPGTIEPTAPSAPAHRVVSLWTPKNIFWLGVFLGWPTALVLSIINWFRMGLWKKALIFSGGGLAALILFFMASYKLPDDSSRVQLLILNLFFLVALQSLMNIDFAASGYPGATFKPISIGWGILIGILTLAVIFVSLVLIFMFIELAKFFFAPTPIIPLPGKEGLKEMQMAALFLFF